MLRQRQKVGVMLLLLLNNAPGEQGACEQAVL